MISWQNEINTQFNKLPGSDANFCCLATLLLPSCYLIHRPIQSQTKNTCPNLLSSLPTRKTTQLQDIYRYPRPRAQNLQQPGASTDQKCHNQNSTAPCKSHSPPPNPSSVSSLKNLPHVNLPSSLIPPSPTPHLLPYLPSSPSLILPLMFYLLGTNRLSLVGYVTIYNIYY